MCGIAGLLRPGWEMAKLTAVAGAMADRLAHRGPDDKGVWVDGPAGLALGHRRLSILELSELGSQPMESADSRYALSFNGEIYNHLEIRRELKKELPGKSFRGGSDTETLVEAIAAWGVRAGLQRTAGMFALAVWDRKNRVLSLARDRMGEKPLYYGLIEGAWVFGSELKALRAFPGWNGEIDRDALSLVFRYGCIPAPYCVYQGIRKLPPASLVHLAAPPANGAAWPRPEEFWSLRCVAECGEAEALQRRDSDLEGELTALLERVVSEHRVADVPVGALLSGGIDSSLITALFQRQSSQPVRTFTVSFREAEFDESTYASRVAQALGTQHTELLLRPEEALSESMKMPEMYDEPFSDSSQLAVSMIARLARSHVKVSLTGDGGDEVFAGYNRYVLGPRVWRMIKPWPDPFRDAADKAVTILSNRIAGSGMQGVRQSIARGAGLGLLLEKLERLQAVFPSRSPQELYLHLVSHWERPDTLVPRAVEPPTLPTQPALWPPLGEMASVMQYLDMSQYLPDDILVKVDRATMAVGLESRAPFLDHRVVEFAWRLPMDLKVHGSRGKWLLRRLLGRYIPSTLFSRPKAGFSLPLGAWLRGPFKDWAESLLSEEALSSHGFLEVAPIRQAWKTHLGGSRNLQRQLWDALMVQAWLENIRRDR